MEQINTFGRYSIFARGSKQHQAVEGRTLAIDRIEGEPGETVEFKEVLFRKLGDNNFEIGKPFLTGSVKAVIVKQMKGPKTFAKRFKRRKKLETSNNGRARLTVIRFESI